MNHTLPNWHGSDLTEAEILEQLPPLEWDYDTAVHDREQYLSPVLKTFHFSSRRRHTR